jgi:ChrB-like protein
MIWIVFSYTVPSKPRSSFRVSVWRRLGRLGALSTTSGVYILPAREECIEALQWLAQETRQAGGDALVMRVEQFEGMTDGQWIERFNQARAPEYEEIDAQGRTLEKSAHRARHRSQTADIQDQLAKLRRQYQEILRVDYFSCPSAGPVGMRLDAIEQMLALGQTRPARVAAHKRADYQQKRWVTRS